VWLAVRSSGRTGLLIAAAWGALSDGLSRGPLGIDVLLFVLAAWCCQVVYARRPADFVLSPAAITGFVVFAVQTASAGARAVCDGAAVDLQRLTYHAAGPAFSTAILVLALASAWRLGGQSLATGKFAPFAASNHWR
jgi:rod shape-determining protein MreD